MEALLEMLVDDGRQGRADLPHIRHSLGQAPSGELPQEPFLLLLRESLDTAVAERALRTAIEWGRYGEVFRVQLPHRPDSLAGRGRGRRG